MSTLRGNSSTNFVLSLAGVGSILTFAGWVLALAPAFHRASNVTLVVVFAVVGFGLVLVPAGLDIITPSRPDRKGRRMSVVVAIIPALVIFGVVAATLPIGRGFLIAAIVAEVVGVLIYGWAWWLAHDSDASSLQAPADKAQ